MKGIILAGGSGTRLYPITKGISKQLIPIYNKPMIYYPLSVLLYSGIKEILIISTPDDINNFNRIFNNGSHLGITIEYEIQKHPGGLAEAFTIGEKFIGNDDVCLVLGDNIFHGIGLIDILKNSVFDVKNNQNAVVFGYRVNNPQDYGVVEFQENKVISIEEKPKNPKSNFAVVGLYFYPNDVVNKAKNIKPSKRGELEITSINEEFLKEEKLNVKLLGRGFTWLDTGTHESLLEANNFVHAIEKRQGLMISCIEEIVFDLGYIDSNQLLKISKPLLKNDYGKYLIKKIKNE